MTKIYTQNDTDLLKQANSIMGVVVDSLRQEGFITEDQAADIHTNYSVILEDTSWCPDFLAKFLRLQEGRLRIRLVKAIGRSANT